MNDNELGVSLVVPGSKVRWFCFQSSGCGVTEEGRKEDEEIGKEGKGRELKDRVKGKGNGKGKRDRNKWDVIEMNEGYVRDRKEASLHLLFLLQKKNIAREKKSVKENKRDEKNEKGREKREEDNEVRVMIMKYPRRNE